MNYRDLLYSRTWTFNPHTLSVSPNHFVPAELDLHRPPDYQPRAPPISHPKYDDKTMTERFKYPYEIELDEELLQENEKRSAAEKQKFLEQNILPFNMHKPSVRNVYISEALRKTVEPFTQLLVDYINREIECENLRCELCMRPDFRINKLFYLFQTMPKHLKDDENVLLEEFQTACKGFQIDTDKIDVQLLMTRFQKISRFTNLEEISIDYYDFYHLFYPLSRGTIFEQKMIERYEPERERSKEKRFHIETNALIENLLRLLLSQEHYYEMVRRDVQRFAYDVAGMYEFINEERSELYEGKNQRVRDSLTLKRFTRFFVENDIFFRPEELKLFFFRLNHNKANEEVNCKQFVREFEPKVKILGPQALDRDEEKNLITAQLERASIGSATQNVKQPPKKK